MGDPKYNFQYCQKIILFSKDWQSVLLAKRHSEADYDGVFSFIGGKMETTDASILEGLRREKNEEIGTSSKIKIYLDATYNVFFRKQDGNAMILPHYLAQFIDGEIQLNNEEYAEYRWIPCQKLDAFEPKIENILGCVNWALELHNHITRQNFTDL